MINDNDNVSSIDIEVIKTVFNFIYLVFFIKKILSIQNTSKKHLSNIQPNISMNKKASQLTFIQTNLYLRACKKPNMKHLE